MNKVFGRPIYWIGNLVSAAIFYLFYHLGGTGVVTGFWLFAGVLVAPLGVALTLIYVLKTNANFPAKEQKRDHDERVA